MGNSTTMGNCHTRTGVAFGTMGGCVVAGGASQYARNLAPEGIKNTSAVAAGAIVGVPSVVVGVALGLAVGGTADLWNIAEGLRHEANSGAAGIVDVANTVGDNLSSMRLKREHAWSRGQTSEGVADLPTEANPFLISLAVARRARVISEEDAFERAADFSVRCAVEKLTPEEVFEEAEASGRVMITYVKLQECYPNENRQTIEEVARSLAKEDPDACDAAWVVCGHKSFQEWSKHVRKAMPKRVVDVSPELLERALQSKFQEVLPSLIDRLQEICPGGSQKGYEHVIKTVHRKLPTASFWKIWKMLQDPELPKELQGLTFDRLSSAEFVQHIESAMSSNSALTCSEAARRASNVESITKFSPTSRKLKSQKGELKVEVLCTESLCNPEYRVGDMTSSLFGGLGITSKKMFPYVEVSWGKESLQTRIVESVDGNVKFGESLCFPVEKDAMDEFKIKEKVHVRCFDARGAQAAIRGDPLFGEVRIEVTEKMLIEDSVTTLYIKRDGEKHGKVLVRFSYRPPNSAHDALAQTKDRTLAEVVRALAHVLRHREGVKMLLKARPLPTKGVSEESMKSMLKDWVQQFLRSVESLKAQASDKESSKHLVPMAASLQMIVSASVPPGTTTSQIQGVAAAWFRAFLQAAAASVIEEDVEAGVELSAVDEPRLMQLLQAGSASLKHCRREGTSAGLVPPKYWVNQGLQVGEPIKHRTTNLDSTLFNLLHRSATHKCCSGRDGTFEVESIKHVTSYRLENPITWTQYRNKVAELAARHEADRAQCAPLRPPVPAHMRLQGLDDVYLDESMNEVFLWHATKRETVDLIMKEGFDERVCSLHGLFGAGVYFAEESCKSGQYAQKDAGCHYFFLCRVLLGRPYYATSSMNHTRRAPEGTDSVIANVGAAINLGHRELIVYDRFQAYPEFLVVASTNP